MKAMLIGALLAAALAVGAQTAAAGEVLDRILARGHVLLMGEPAWPPFSFKDESGAYAGFDVDVADEVARRLGVAPLRIERALTWEQETGGHWDGVIDISIGSMTPTAKRSENLVFTEAYAYNIASLAVHRDNASINTLADADGKRIGVLRTSIYDLYLNRMPIDVQNALPVTHVIKDPVIVHYEIEAEALAGLEKGDGVEMDATINALVVLMEEIRLGRPFRIVGQPLFYLPGAIAIEPGDPELEERLRMIVADMHSDGTLARYAIKWFGIDITSMP